MSCIKLDMEKHDVLDHAVSNKEKEFVEKALEKELDVAVDIVEAMVDSLCGFCCEVGNDWKQVYGISIR